MGNNRVVIPKLQYVYIHTKHNSHVGNKHPVKRPLSDFFTKYTSIFTRPFYLLISSAMHFADELLVINVDPQMVEVKHQINWQYVLWHIHA